MHFPVVFHLGSFELSAHTVFESLGYTIAFWLHRHLKRNQGDFLAPSDRFTIIATAIVGAAAGSKILFWFEDPIQTIHAGLNPIFLMGGKTIVGALLLATIAVEWIKRRTGITRRTGDLFALPIIVGMAVGRIGCFLAGLPDGTCGTATSLPWGIDFGDGVARHPTQLYEIGFLLLAGTFIGLRGRHPYREGDLFRYFLVSYMIFRLFIDFLKPGVPFLGLTAIQWACAAAILAYWRDVRFWFAPSSAT